MTLRHFFGIIGGMGGTKLWEEDRDMISFWRLPDEQDLNSPADPVTHVAPLPTVWDAAPNTMSDYFVLGDWSIMCFVFCARLPTTPAETTEIYYYDGGEPIRLASTLQEFLIRYAEHGLQGLFPGTTPQGGAINVV